MLPHCSDDCVFLGEMSNEYQEYMPKVCIPRRFTQGVQIIQIPQIKQEGTYIAQDNAESS